MKTKSEYSLLGRKIAKGLLFLFLFLGSFSCAENEEYLPNRLVNLTVDLGDARYTSLSVLGGYYEFKEGDPYLPPYSALGNGGILLVYSVAPIDPSEPYAAYDLFCTNEKDVRVKTQKGGLEAICPKCESKYDLSSGMGTCTSGPNKGKRLEIYKAVCVGKSVRVTR